MVQSQLWRSIYGHVHSEEGNIVILEIIGQSRYRDVTEWTFLALTNFPGEAVVDKTINGLAMKIGIYNYGGDTPIELFDMGKPYVPTPEEIAAAKAAQEKAKADAKAKAAEQKKIAAARALQANRNSAAKGDSFGLMRMGERYRDGDGVEKDLAKAKEYLQRAADAGSTTAADELSKLKQ